MAASRGARPVTARAHAKINLTLRIVSVRPDGYHALRTTFQTLALHDTLTFRFEPGPFALACTDPACPVDATNLVWRAAARIWRAAGRRGAPHGVRIRVTKRIPMQAGLGGGSSDAAATLRVLAAAWTPRLARARMLDIAAELGADVPFCLSGGTALGLERGDLIVPLPNLPKRWVAIVIPAFGVSTADAYRWWDRQGGGHTRGRRASVRNAGEGPLASWLPEGERGNDLERAVAARHPEIARLVRGLRRAGAEYAAMSGSGSAVFGLFGSRRTAERAARALAGRGRRALVTWTRGRTAP